MKKAIIYLALLASPFLATSQNGKVKTTITHPKVSDLKGLIKEDQILHDEIIVSVDEHSGNRLVVSKLNTACKLISDTINIDCYQFYRISETNTAFSVVNIPFKIRLKTDSLPSNVETGIENAGIFIGRKREIKRYFYNGKETTHAISAGIFFSPTAIKLNAENTDGKVETEVTQLAISTGIGFSYTYQKLSFMIIPLGFDFGITSKTSKWVYNGKYWFGFGLGIDVGYFL